MALEKVIVIDKIEIVGKWKHVQVRTAERIVEDGNVISQSFSRHFISPDKDSSNEDPQVQAICEVVHTPELKAQYAEHVSANAQVEGGD